MGGVCGQSVAIETLPAAVTEESVRVVDALQTLARLTVAVSHGVGVDVVAALTDPTGPDRTALTQRVAKEAVVTQLAAFTCGGGAAALAGQEMLGLRGDCAGQWWYLWFLRGSWCRPPPGS